MTIHTKKNFKTGAHILSIVYRNIPYSSSDEITIYDQNSGKTISDKDSVCDGFTYLCIRRRAERSLRSPATKLLKQYWYR